MKNQSSNLVDRTHNGGINPNAIIAEPSIAGIERAPDPSNALQHNIHNINSKIIHAMI
jgi:hypothetical protein